MSEQFFIHCKSTREETMNSWFWKREKKFVNCSQWKMKRAFETELKYAWSTWESGLLRTDWVIMRNTAITSTITMHYIIHTYHKSLGTQQLTESLRILNRAFTTLWEEFNMPCSISNMNSIRAKGFIYSLHRSLNIFHGVLVPSKEESTDWLCEIDFKALYVECK